MIDIQTVTRDPTRKFLELKSNPKLLMSVRKSSKFDSIISCLELGFRFHTEGEGLALYFQFSL